MGIIDYLIFFLVIWLIFEIVKDFFVKNISPELRKAGEKVKNSFTNSNTEQESIKKDENGEYVVDFDNIKKQAQGFKINKEILIPVLVFVGILILPFLLQFAGLIFPIAVIGFIFREPLIKLYNELTDKK